MSKNLLVMCSVVVASASLYAQSCDATAAAAKVFKDQGLVVLKPARTYVKPGGLVSLKGDAARYRDPADPVPTDPKVATPFSATIMSETRGKTTGFGSAISAISSFVTAPLGLKFNSSSQVSLAQIDATGVRLIDDAVEAQIAKPRIAAKLMEWITVDDADAFIVQEVYLAKSLDLSASTTGALDVTFGDGKAPGTCAAKPSAQSGTSGKQPAAPSSGVGGGNSTPASPASVASAEAAKQEAAKSGASIGVGVELCKTSDSKLRFETGSHIQFAVRLVQIEFRDKRLRVKEGKFKFPNSLGNSKVERITAVPREALTLEPDTSK